MKTVKYVVYYKDGNDRREFIEPTLPRAWSRMEAILAKGGHAWMDRIEEDES